MGPVTNSSPEKTKRRWVELMVYPIVVLVVGGLLLGLLQRWIEPQNPSATAPPPTSATKVTSTPTAPSGDPTTSTTARPSQLKGGVYRGVAVQDSKQAKAWTVTVTLAGDQGIITYALDGSPRSCKGVLNPTTNDTWLEHITEGTCDNLGSWVFHQTGQANIIGTYRPASGAYTVTADLRMQ